MKPYPIFKLASGRRCITLFSDLRIQREGPKINVWSFPAPSLGKAIRSVNAFCAEAPHTKWTVIIDRTDEQIPAAKP